MVRLLAIYCHINLKKNVMQLPMHYPNNAIFDLEQLVDACAPNSLFIIGTAANVNSAEHTSDYRLGSQYQQQRQSIHKPCEISRLTADISINNCLLYTSPSPRDRG